MQYPHSLQLQDKALGSSSGPEGVGTRRPYPHFQHLKDTWNTR